MENQIELKSIKKPNGSTIRVSKKTKLVKPQCTGANGGMQKADARKKVKKRGGMKRMAQMQPSSYVPPPTANWRKSAETFSRNLG